MPTCHQSWHVGSVTRLALLRMPCVIWGSGQRKTSPSFTRRWRLVRGRGGWGGEFDRSRKSPRWDISIITPYRFYVMLLKSYNRPYFFLDRGRKEGYPATALGGQGSLVEQSPPSPQKSLPIASTRRAFDRVRVAAWRLSLRLPWPTTHAAGPVRGNTRDPAPRGRSPADTGLAQWTCAAARCIRLPVTAVPGIATSCPPRYLGSLIGKSCKGRRPLVTPCCLSQSWGRRGNPHACMQPGGRARWQV